MFILYLLIGVLIGHFLGDKIIAFVKDKLPPTSGE